MGDTRKTFITSKSKTVMLAASSFVMYYVFLYMLNPYDVWWKHYFTSPIADLLIEWIQSLVFCVLVSVGSVLIHGQLNKHLPWIERPVSRLAVEILLNIAWVLVLIFVIALSIKLIEGTSQSVFNDQDENVGYWQWLTISIFIALTVNAIHTGDYLITNWKNAALEATEHKLKSAQHKQAAAEAELQALKLQLDPHFVFNNLSVLSELILEDQQLGFDYAENFSKVYRYLLLNSRKNLIVLEEELRFLKSYIFLLEQRAGNGVEFEINIDDADLKLLLPPLTLQLLIENAIKHNKLLRARPLKIRVLSGQHSTLIVSNSLIPLEKKQLSPGLGLQNIVQRYRLLSDRVPNITENESSFSVSIPLIKHDKEHIDY